MHWLGRSTQFCPSPAAEHMEENSDAHDQHSTLGIVYPEDCKDIPPKPIQTRFAYIHGRSGDGLVRRKWLIDQETASEATFDGW
jgi:hypothetical protein